MSKKRASYLSYVLRLWQEDSKKKEIWRASLQCSATGECKGFASLDELLEFLRQRASANCNADNDADGTRIR